MPGADTFYNQRENEDNKMNIVKKVLGPIVWLITIVLVGCASSAQVKMDVLPDCPPGKVCHANVKSGVGRFEVGSADSTSLVYTAPEKKGEKPPFLVAGYSGVPSATSLVVGAVLPAAISAAGNIGGAGLIAHGMTGAQKIASAAAKSIADSSNTTALKLNEQQLANQKPSTIFNMWGGTGGNAGAIAGTSTNVNIKDTQNVLPTVNLGH